MTTIDIVIGLLLLWGAINGFIKGFVVQVLTFAALILGIWAAAHFYEPAGEWLSHLFSLPEKVMHMVSFILLFLVILIAMHFLGKLITNSLGKSTLGKLNRIAGLLLGMLKIAFMMSVVFFIIQKIDTKEKLLTPSVTQGSKLYKPVAALAPFIFPHLHIDSVKEKLKGH